MEQPVVANQGGTADPNLADLAKVKSLEAEAARQREMTPVADFMTYLADHSVVEIPAADIARTEDQSFSALPVKAGRVFEMHGENLVLMYKDEAGNLVRLKIHPDKITETQPTLDFGQQYPKSKAVVRSIVEGMLRDNGYNLDSDFGKDGEFTPGIIGRRVDDVRRKAGEVPFSTDGNMAEPLSYF